MAITWKQIDTNGNGYVDGTEAVTAKSHGVKNIWNNMTQLDFQTNVTREQKLDSIKKSYFSYDGIIRENVYVGPNSQEARANDKKQKEDALLQLHNKYEKYVREHADELAELDNKQMNLFKFWYKSGVANLKELCNEKLNASFVTSKERKELAEHDKANESYMAIKQQIWNMEEQMNNLLNEIESL